MLASLHVLLVKFQANEENCVEEEKEEEEEERYRGDISALDNPV